MGKAQDKWVNDQFHEYAKRLPKDWSLDLIEIANVKVTRNFSAEVVKKMEAEKITKVISLGSIVVSLDEHGNMMNSKQLSWQLSVWHNESRNINLIVGGANGLDQTIITQSHLLWSLSPLTFPHQLVRIMVAEQIYRSWSIFANHPYHRS